MLIMNKIEYTETYIEYEADDTRKQGKGLQVGNYVIAFKDNEMFHSICSYL